MRPTVGLADPLADAAIDALRQCRLFNGLDDVSLGLVRGALRPRRFRKGEKIRRLKAQVEDLHFLTCPGDWPGTSCVRCCATRTRTRTTDQI